MQSYPEGNTSLSTDSEHRSLVKIVDLLNGGATGGANPLMHGSGAPDNVTNAPADPTLTWLWHDDDTGNVFWWLASSGQWTA